MGYRALQYVYILMHECSSAYARSERQHTSAYVSINVSIHLRQHTSALTYADFQVRAQRTARVYMYYTYICM